MATALNHLEEGRMFQPEITLLDAEGKPIVPALAYLAFSRELAGGPVPLFQFDTFHNGIGEFPEPHWSSVVLQERHLAYLNQTSELVSDFESMKPRVRS